MTDKTDIVVETLAGPNRLQMEVENGKVVSVRSNMGRPRFNRSEIPMRGEDDGPVKEYPLDLGNGETLHITCANIGNPHAVIFVEDATAVDLRHYGPLVENHPEFPQRTNVEFVNVVDRNNIVMRIWERGSGITMASGSGSCGSALACMLTDRTDRKVQVHLVYGTLTIEWAEDGNVYQQGPATEVFSGEWPED
jgi:diaminopimelate epimerase